jgi:hypothetical protein
LVLRIKIEIEERDMDRKIEHRERDWGWETKLRIWIGSILNWWGVEVGQERRGWMVS